MTLEWKNDAQRNKLKGMALEKVVEHSMAFIQFKEGDGDGT